MNRNVFLGITTFAAAALMVSCEAIEGTMPGNDAEPVVTIYQYSVSLPHNPDNDCSIRFAANAPTEEAYYLVEPTSDKESRVNSVGEDGYADYVVANGVKLAEIKGASSADVLLTDLMGPYTITAVAVGNGKKHASEASFTGLQWEDVTTGTYYFEAIPNLGLSERGTTLQVCTSDDTLYRFKDVFAEGYHLKIRLYPDYTGQDEDGAYTFFRVEAQQTPYTYGNYGTVSVRDIGYWQGNDAFIFEGGYESGIYADGSCFLCLQYFVSAGNLGYDYDYFIAD